MASAAQLTQIRQGYTAVWNNLALSVESGPAGWRASVQDLPAKKGLHTAYRFSQDAAKLAAVEFAIFYKAERQEPARVSRDLNWKIYW